jgi:hypothetical protein
MDIPNLLHKLTSRKSIEIVVTRLPEPLTTTFEKLRRLSFEHSKKRGQRTNFRLAGEKVYMLGHQDISMDGEFMTPRNFFDDSFKGVLGIGIVQKRKTVITTEGDEVKLASILTTFKAQWHSWILTGYEGKRFALPRECPLMR